MIFSSFKFIFIFLPICVILYHILPTQKYKKIFLIIASIYFYASWKIHYLPIIVFSILINYLLHIFIHKNNSKPIFILSIAFNIGLLIIFKYKYFLLDLVNLNSGSTITASIPLGISFFTFQQIAFQSDLFLKKIKKNKLLDYSLFVCFFPQLIAGPIVHYSNIIPQLQKKINFSFQYFSLGLFIFSCGLFKKTVIADQLGLIVDKLFSKTIEQVNFYESWLASLGYTYQLYFDFSGYSEMAIGIGLFFGVKLPLNFYSPYKSSSIVEFWRRWHITLSTFLKDYLYIPLGGNRNGVSNKYRNLLITMFLGGLWHGAGLTFILWGSLHGVALALNNWFRKFKIRTPLLVGKAFTFLFVVIAWVYFRANTIEQGNAFISKMFNLGEITLPPILYRFLGAGYSYSNDNYYLTVILIFCAFLICNFAPNISQIVNRNDVIIKNGFKIKDSILNFKPNLFYLSFTIITFITSLYYMSTGVSTFLYFEF